MSEGRSVWRMIWQNFKKSLKLLPPKGKFVGEDNLGNKYFEAVKGYYICKHFLLIFQSFSFKLAMYVLAVKRQKLKKYRF